MKKTEQLEFLVLSYLFDLQRNDPRDAGDTPPEGMDICQYMNICQYLKNNGYIDGDIGDNGVIFAEINFQGEKRLEELEQQKDKGLDLSKNDRNTPSARAVSGIPAPKGRTKAKEFEEYIKEGVPKKILMPILEAQLRGKSGEGAAKIIIAITGVWIDQTPTVSVCNRFPSVKESAFNSAMNKHYGTNSYVGSAKPFREEDLESIRETIRKELHNCPQK